MIGSKFQFVLIECTMFLKKENMLENKSILKNPPEISVYLKELLVCLFFNGINL
jgi:hypothetical protein